MNLRSSYQRLRRTIAAFVFVTSASFASPLAAQEEGPDPVQFDGLVEIRAVESDLDFDQGEGIDSSGFGVRARLGIDFDLGETTGARIEAEGRVFDFRDENRDTLETFVGRIHVTQKISDEVEVRAHVRRFENIAVLEAFSADQTSVGARVEWESGNDRVRVSGEYREREYDTSVGGNSDGFSASAQYNRRLGSYHWLRLDLRADKNESADEPRRSYDRRVARLRYNMPVAKRMQFRPSIEYREWDYPSRIAQGDPNGDLRRDSFIAPAVELAWGRTSRGLYANASAQYRFKQSNDERFDSDAIRVGVRVGFRF